MADFCSGVPACDTSVPPSTTVAKNGSSTSDRPNDSITVASSAPPIPAPSHCPSKGGPGQADLPVLRPQLAAPAELAVEQLQPAGRVVALVKQAVHGLREHPLFVGRIEVHRFIPFRTSGSRGR